jgi:histidine triad (HIT) family protein
VATNAECIFCRIVSGDIPSARVYEDALVVAFRDIQPAAPVHVLVVPREHVGSLHDLSEQHDELAGALLRATRRVAEQEGVATTGYRVLTNVGEHGGQSVDHLHFHVLGGRQLGALG